MSSEYQKFVRKPAPSLEKILDPPPDCFSQKSQLFRYPTFDSQLINILRGVIYLEVLGEFFRVGLPLGRVEEGELVYLVDELAFHRHVNTETHHKCPSINWVQRVRFVTYQISTAFNKTSSQFFLIKSKCSLHLINTDRLGN